MWLLLLRHLWLIQQNVFICLRSQHGTAFWICLVRIYSCYSDCTHTICFTMPPNVLKRPISTYGFLPFCCMVKVTSFSFLIRRYENIDCSQSRPVVVLSQTCYIFCHIQLETYSDPLRQKSLPALARQQVLWKRLSNTLWKRRCISRQTKLRMYWSPLCCYTDRRRGTWPSVITIDRMHLTWAACADSKISNGVNMYETSLSDNKLNSAPSQSPWRSVDCAGSVTCIVCHPKVKSWNCTTSPRAQSAARDQGAVHDGGGWTAFHKTSQSSTSPSQRQFVSPSIGLYRENAIAIQNESGDSNGGNV